MSPSFRKCWNPENLLVLNGMYLSLTSQLKGECSAAHHSPAADFNLNIFWPRVSHHGINFSSQHKGKSPAVVWLEQRRLGSLEGWSWPVGRCLDCVRDQGFSWITSEWRGYSTVLKVASRGNQCVCVCVCVYIGWDSYDLFSRFLSRMTTQSQEGLTAETTFRDFSVSVTRNCHGY